VEVKQKRKFEDLPQGVLREKLASTQASLSALRAEREAIDARVAELGADEYELGLELDRLAPRPDPQADIRTYLETQQKLREERARAKVGGTKT
jgi:hypothetical protein